MNEFLKIFQENINQSPKAIITAGGASVGKSTVIKAIQPMIEDFKILNADSYVEDKNSPMYNNVAASHSHIKKVDFPDAIKSNSNIVYDTTAGNIKTITPFINDLKSNNYDIIMIMVYAHPIISFIRNFKRERKVPAGGVISTWVNVYSLMEDYKKMFGDKFFLIVSPASTKEELDKIEEFNEAYDSGNLKGFFLSLINSGEYSSSFKKNDDELSPEELEKLEKSREKTKQNTEANIDKLVEVYKKIEDSLNPIEVGDLPNQLGKFI